MSLQMGQPSKAVQLKELALFVAEEMLTVFPFLDMPFHQAASLQFSTFSRATFSLFSCSHCSQMTGRFGPSTIQIH